MNGSHWTSPVRRQAGTFYLIAESIGEDAPVAPLFACLTTEIHYLAGQLGSGTQRAPRPFKDYEKRLAGRPSRQDGD